MLIYVNITDRRTDGQTHQNYSSEPHKINVSYHGEVLKKYMTSTWGMGGIKIGKI